MFLVKNGFDIAWLLVGLFGTFTVAAIISTLTQQWLRSRQLGSRSQTYERVLVAVEGLLQMQDQSGKELHPTAGQHHAKSLAVLLKSQRTVTDAVAALADAARARPQVASILRGRDALNRAIAVWVEARLSSKDQFERAHAVEVIASLRMRTCRGALAAATNDSDPVVRAGACRALAAIDPAAAIGALLRVIETDGSWAGDLLADLLARTEQSIPGDPQTASPTAGRATDDVQRDAVNARLLDWSATPALLRIADQSMPASAKRALESALESGDPEMRLRSLTILRSQPFYEASPALERLVNDHVEAVRVAAIGAIAQIGRDEHVMLLAALVGDASRMVRFAAAEAIRTLTGGKSLLRTMSNSVDPNVSEAASLALWKSGVTVVDDLDEELLALVEAGKPQLEARFVELSPDFV